MYIYDLPPVDWWEAFVPLDEYERDIAQDPDNEWTQQVEKFRAWVEQAKVEIKRRTLWEGDIVQGPYVSGLPDGETSGAHVFLTFKQDNNGSTYLASPVALPWLQQYEARTPR